MAPPDSFAAGSLVPDVARIAVLRANALGDFIFSLPALDALRAAYPAAEIVLLARRWHRDFLAGRPGPIDRVVVLPDGVLNDDGSTTCDPAVLEAFFAEMAAERFDLAIQLHGGGRNSNPLLLRLGARLNAGLRSSDAPALDRWTPYIYFQNEYLRYLEVVALVGARPTVIEPQLAVTARDVAEARAVLPEGEGPLTVLHPGASDGRRRWPPAKFAAVGDALAAAGATVAVVGVPSERALVDAVRAAMSAPALDLCGRLSLGGLAGLLSLAAVLVGNDSGPLHLAEAVGAATAGIYWCGNLINGAPATRTRHRPFASWQLDCPVCGVNCIDGRCDHDASFVAEVPVDAVAAAALDLLARAVDLPAHG